MSTYAYRKPDKSDEVAAEDLYSEPAGKTYYCPDPDCLAWLTPVMRNGIRNPISVLFPAIRIVRVAPSRKTQQVRRSDMTSGSSISTAFFPTL